MLYDTIKFQPEPGFAGLIPPNYTQELSTSTYVERNRKAATDSKPLQIVAASDTEITITTGVVNYNNYPTISGTSINNDPKPSLAITSDSYIWIKCAGTFGSTDSYVVTIERTGSSSPPSSSTITGTGFTSCFLIGTVEVLAGKISTITNIFSGGNLGVESFGSTNMWWAT